MNKVNEIYATICKTNDKKIISGEMITPICVFIKDNESELMNFEINKKTKSRVVANIKLLATEKEVDGYVIVFDANALITNKKTHTESEEECVVRTLYTKTDRVTEIVWIRGSSILSKQEFSGRGRNPDEWDAWWTPGVRVILNIDEKKNKKNKNEEDFDINKFRYK